MGKSYFFRLLGFRIVAEIIEKMLDIDVARDSWIIYIMIVLISKLYYIFVDLYITNLCKIRGEIDKVV